MHFQVFIPGAHEWEPEGSDRLFAKIGLELLADDNKPAVVDASLNIRDEQKLGLLIGWVDSHGAGSAVCVKPGQQTWHPAPPNPARELAAERYWFGTENRHPVKPLDIARAGHHGSPVTLGDDQDWIIPIAKQLPHAWGVDPRTGTFARNPSAPYQNFCRHAQDVYQAFRTAAGLQVPIDSAWEYACEALAINYRVCPEIVGWLGLINDRCFLPLIQTTIDLQLIAEVEDEKKNSE